MHLVFENEEVLLFADLRGGDTVVTSFAHMDFYKGIPTFWGATALEKIGVSAIGFVCKRNTWFPQAAMSEALPFALEILSRFKHKISYGFSMGGYGALKFSNALTIDISLALSPQVTIATNFQEDQRFVRFYDRTLNYGMMVTGKNLALRTYILYDPFEAKDALNFDLIQRMAPANVEVRGIRCHHVGHDTPLIIASTFTLAKLFNALAEESCPFSVEQTIKIARRTTPRRAVGLAVASLMKRPATADAIVAKHGSKMGEYWLSRYDRAKNETLGNALGFRAET